MGKRWAWLVLGPALVIVVAGCDNSKMRSLSDTELVEKSDDCRRMNDPAPILVQWCRSVERECKRRERELRLYLCG